MEECNDIFAFLGLPRIGQREVKSLKGILRLVLAFEWF